MSNSFIEKNISINMKNNNNNDTAITAPPLSANNDNDDNITACDIDQSSYLDKNNIIIIMVTVFIIEITVI
jgi:hypothetical protein